MKRTKLTSEQKAENARARMMRTAKKYSPRTYAHGPIADLFQEMIRAEAGALPSCHVVAVVKAELSTVFRAVGQCVCVTCGRVDYWNSGIEGIHCGHFLASRVNSILFEEENCAPQCCYCNYHRDGEQQLFRKWMLAVRGEEVVERLERLKNTTVQFNHEQLVDMNISFRARLRAAEQRMKGE